MPRSAPGSDGPITWITSQGPPRHVPTSYSRAEPVRSVGMDPSAQATRTQRAGIGSTAEGRPVIGSLAATTAMAFPFIR